MAKNKSETADCIISGGGIAGLTLALLLENHGLNVHLLDPYPPKPNEDIMPTGRTVALMQGSLNILTAAGLSDEAIIAISAPLEFMRIIDDSLPDQNNQTISFDSREIDMACFGRNIPNGLLRALLFEIVKKNVNITFHESGLTDYSVDDCGVTARLEKDITLRAPLLIGVDGRNSKVREIAGIEVKRHNYGQSAITCLINHSRPHDNIATEFHRSSGPFAMVPLPGHQSSIVWVEKTEQADKLMALRKSDFQDALQERTANTLGAITLEAGPESWPLSSIRAKTLIAPRVAIAAEAAHVISPITAQGLNLSLRDVATLAEILIDHAKLGLDIGSETVLKHYNQRRQPDMISRVMGVNGLSSLVSTDIKPLKILRRGGLKAIDSNAAIRKISMTLGLAPALDQSRFARKAG